ncbi:MAG: glycosyltransferase, partial [Lentisphaeria bacterium]|nr:glycosyltransferase [Lentisphaeria bacterium]
GFEAVAAEAIRLPRGPLQALVFPFKFLSCILQNRRQLKKFHVNVALCMGSFASVPMGLATRLLKIPLCLHEGNAILGQANRLQSRWAKVLGLTYPLLDNYKTKAPQVHTGMPIRQPLLDEAKKQSERSELCKELSLNEELPILFVFGGSQGARAINDAIKKLINEQAEIFKTMQLILFTGQDDNADWLKFIDVHGIKAVIKARDPEIHKFYTVCDFIICRSGASTLAELAVFSKAPLMIPYPAAKYDHQTANAQTVVNADSGWLLKEAELSSESLAKQLNDWLKNGNNKNANHQSIARDDAAEKMVDLLKQYAV